MSLRLPDAADRLFWVGGVMLAVAGVGTALLFDPIPGDAAHLDLFGHRLGPTCTLLLATGLPCPSCGMTRSWVSLVHGDLPAALGFNVAGVALLAGVITNAVYSTWRLVGGRLRAWMPRAAAGAAIAWLVLFMVSWGVRLAGFYPLP